jgi:hypothetical protein
VIERVIGTLMGLVHGLPGTIEPSGAAAQPVGRVEMLHRRFVVLEVVKRLAEREVQYHQREIRHSALSRQPPHAFDQRHISNRAPSITAPRYCWHPTQWPYMSLTQPRI